MSCGNPNSTNKKISELDPCLPLVSTTQFVVNCDGTTENTTLGEICDFCQDVEGEFGPITVGAGLSVVVSTFTSATTRGAKWFVTADHNPGTLERRWFEVAGVHNGVSADAYVNGVIGDNVKLKVDVDLAGGLLRLVITNNEVIDITVCGSTVRVDCS
jgi:hypothetical protein